jgi:hypothetical protein
MGRMLEGLLQPSHLLIILLPFLFVLLPLWRILAKAGYPGPLSLLALIPIVGLVIIFWLAFSEWPLERAAKQKGFSVLAPYCPACGKPA